MLEILDRVGKAHAERQRRRKQQRDGGAVFNAFHFTASFLASTTLPLEQWEEGFRQTIAKTGFKVLLMPDPSMQDA